MNRREFMQGMAGILASGVAPAFIGSKDITLDTIILRVAPSLHIAKSGGVVYRWDDNYILIPETDPWNEADARILAG